MRKAGSSPGRGKDGKNRHRDGPVLPEPSPGNNEDNADNANTPSMPSPVREIYEELRAGDESGQRHFSLERSKAKEQLRGSLLSDPYSYILLLVRSAVRGRSTLIDLVFGPSRIEMTFDGRGFLRDDLERLYDAPFDGELDDRCPGLRELALGINALGGLGFGLRMETRDRDGNDSVLVSMPGKADLIDPPKDSPRDPSKNRPREPSKNRPGETRIVITGKAFSNDWVPATMACRPEEQLVLQRCRFSPVEIRVSGKTISFDLSSTKDALSVAPIDEEGITGASGFLPLEREKGAVLFLLDGVVVAEQAFEEARCGFVALLRFESRKKSDGPACLRLRLDASESKVVQDETFRKSMNAAKKAWSRTRSKEIPNECRDLIDKRAHEELRSFLRDYRIRQLLYFPFVVVVGWILSTVVVMFLLKTPDFGKRFVDAMLASLLLGTATGAIIVGMSTYSLLLIKPAARLLNRRVPSHTPLRARLEALDEAKKRLYKLIETAGKLGGHS